MDFLDFLRGNIVCLDGGMGTLLQSKGLRAGELPERWNITHPDVIKDIHKAYFDAGSNVVCTNTFGANSLKFSDEELEKIIACAIENAKAARRESVSDQEKYIALDLGPSGKLLAPLGELDFEDAVAVFAKTAKLGEKYGADLVIIETMNDSYETKAALLAVKESTSLPVIVSNAYGADGKLMTGATPSAMAALLEGMGADAIGANCSQGPAGLRGVVLELLGASSVPVILKPNAGLPRIEEGMTVYDVGTDEFSDEVAGLVKRGVRVVGGCCGTTPEYIKALSGKIAGLSPVPVEEKNITVVSSYARAVVFGEDPVLIGERINPTGKKRFKEALKNNDLDYILGEGAAQEERGAHILDVNVGIPDIYEPEMLERTVCALQSLTPLPLQIDTSDPVAMERALRRYNGKAMINSVNGKRESMEAVFPLAKKYGGVVVALTLDENGIPESADARVRIAENILSCAEEYGIKKKDIIFDTLTMTVSADTNAAKITLEAMRRIRYELGCRTSLGVSNVSFGLPARDAVNGTFFAMALSNGLSAAIMNPFSAEMMKTYHTYRALAGLDANCAGYIEAAASFVSVQNAPAPKESVTDAASELGRAIEKGMADKAAAITKEMLAERDALDIVNSEIIPALDRVGVGFEKKTVYLPQLLMSAEAAKSAFEEIKKFVAKNEQSAKKKGIFVIATVKGDIHDIGKNIVKLLLENYGYEVVDLGRDVPPETVADAVVRTHAPMAGLSALMTTTVPAMEETLKLIRARAPWCRVVVGGAVLTKEYAEKMGADKYAADAMETVRYAEEIIG